MRHDNVLSLKRRNLMAALILGVSAGAIDTVVERVDMVLTGGTATPLGYINTYTWLLVSAVLFGLAGAIVTTETQAVIGLITIANPLSWLWPFINPLFAVGVGTVLIVISKFSPRVGTGTKLILMSVICAVLDVPLVYLVVVVVLGLPFIFYQGLLPIYIALQLVPSTFLSYIVVRAIVRSEILGKRS